MRNRVIKEQPPGVFVPIIDRSRCEGGYHQECAILGSPCVAACPYRVLEILPLSAEDKRRMSMHDRLRAWVHRNRQAYVVKESECTACARCVEVCPARGVIKLRRRPAPVPEPPTLQRR
jgi:4Fe-4S ferredoxin